MFARWLHDRVARSLQRHRSGQDDSERRELAEHVANDLYPQLIKWFEEGLPDEAPPARRSGSRRRRSAAPDPPALPSTRCRFAGVSTEAWRGVQPGAGLYDFWTADGAHVRLHEADCTGLTYTPGPRPTVIARFTFPAEWVPVGLEQRPVVVIRFHEAHVLAWETDADEEETYADPGAQGGQVSILDWDGHRLFTLDLLTVRVELTAQAVDVTTEALPA
jgi:hypothetical protein